MCVCDWLSKGIEKHMFVCELECVYVWVRECACVCESVSGGVCVC